MQILYIIIYQNTVETWLIGLGIFVSILISLLIARRLILRRINSLAIRTVTNLDDFISDLIKRTKGFFLIAIAFYIASLGVYIPPEIRQVIRVILKIAVFLQFAFWGNGFIEVLINRKAKQELEEDAENATMLGALGLISKIVLWTVIVLLILDNLPNVEIGSLIASLGIGGIAVALAVQNILGDLFASISIALDKPFVIGDFIIIDNYLGTVEYIGLKTTRVRSLSGEQLVFSNSDLLKSRIRNYKRMARRRVIFALGVTYGTTHEKLSKIPQMIRDIINQNENVTLDRVHFKEFGDFSLNYEIVYYVETPDYNEYMDIQQNVNLDIFKRFEEEDIEFAFPTQTIFLEKEEQKVLAV